eukprot:TRINITY_DN349_c0_g1_i3.p1 TRINITY_DN349_c0_g1~~TRINITY_DN349_c0_g1_i3.p1  ORF type:complete len:475 (+),score=198.98 TRINITY_DN349_c0_g1_i3:106-1530(+)
MASDKSWELVQIKAFTAWLNENLKPRGLGVKDIKTDLSDGILLINFFEELSHKKVKTRYDLKPATRIHKIQNLGVAFSHLEDEMDMRRHGYAAEDIIDTDSRGIKMLLGLLWSLFRKYRIAVIKHSDKSSEEGLLLWCKEQTQGYKGVEIQNFRTSFKDGLAFLALVHHYDPAKTGVKYEEFSNEDPLKNLGAAFEYAEKELGVPKLLEPQEVADGKVDERALVLYTSLFFHAYRANEQARAASDLKAKTEAELEEEKRRKELLVKNNEELQTIIKDLEAKLLREKERGDSLEGSLVSEREESARLRGEISRLENLLKDAAGKQDEDAKKIKDLQFKHGQFEEEIELLKGDVEGFKTKLDQEREETNNVRKLVDEKTNQDGVHRKGLQQLKKHLDLHLEDLHAWQKYLDYEDKATFDFERDVRPLLTAELGEKEFVQQLELLSGRLEHENEAMLKIFKTKAAEAQAAKLAAAKK